MPVKGIVETSPFACVSVICAAVGPRLVGANWRSTAQVEPGATGWSVQLVSVMVYAGEPAMVTFWTVIARSFGLVRMTDLLDAAVPGVMSSVPKSIRAG